MQVRFEQMMKKYNRRASVLMAQRHIPLQHKFCDTVSKSNLVAGVVHVVLGLGCQYKGGGTRLSGVYSGLLMYACSEVLSIL